MQRLGPDGTVMIEQAIRERLGLQPGDPVFQELVGEQVVLTFPRSRAPGSAFGILAGAAQRLDLDVQERLATPEGRDAAADEARGEYVRERYPEGGAR